MYAGIRCRDTVGQAIWRESIVKLTIIIIQATMEYGGSTPSSKEECSPPPRALVSVTTISARLEPSCAATSHKQVPLRHRSGLVSRLSETRCEPSSMGLNFISPKATSNDVLKSYNVARYRRARDLGQDQDELADLFYLAPLANGAAPTHYMVSISPGTWFPGTNLPHVGERFSSLPTTPTARGACVANSTPQFRAIFFWSEPSLVKPPFESQIWRKSQAPA